MASVKCLNCGWLHPPLCTLDAHPLTDMDKLRDGLERAIGDRDARRVPLNAEELGRLKFAGEEPTDCDVRMLLVATLGRMADSLSQMIWLTQEDYDFAQDKVCPCCMSDRLELCDA